MTQIPPPMQPVGYGYGPPQQRPANVWAIVSLVCGIIGCLVITPVVAIITGLVGFGQGKTRGGRGMAVAGILLGLLWCVGGVALVSGGWLLYSKGAQTIAQYAKPQTIALINRVSAGNTQRDAVSGTLTDADLQAVAEAARPLGQCKDLSINQSSFDLSNGVVTVNFSGTAVFDKGSTPIAARMVVDNSHAGGATVTFNRLDLK